jgi:hypothetical protein
VVVVQAPFELAIIRRSRNPAPEWVQGSNDGQVT